MPSLDQATAFIRWMHGAAMGDGHQCVTWFAPSRACKFHSTPEAAAAYAVDINSKHDDPDLGQNAYLGMGLQADPPDRGRGTKKRITAISGVWVDVDYGEQPKKKKAIPPDQAAAWGLLGRVGAAPSIVTHTGHGVHGFWLFEEPWIIDSTAERAAAQQFVKLWDDTVRAIAQQSEWTTDSTHDLSRVMRIPGTVNWKNPQRPVECTILEPRSGSPARYEIQELAALTIPLELSSGKRKTRRAPVGVAPVTPRGDGAAPAIVQTLTQNDGRFRKTWERKRTDHAAVGWSASEYDLAVASALVQIGETDQVIADAILAWRTLHNATPEKARRRDYLMRTISKARTGYETTAALQAVDVMVNAPDATEDPDDPGEVAAQRERVLENLSRALRVQLVDFIQHGREEATYSLVIRNGQGDRDVLLGKIDAVITSSTFRKRLAEAAHLVIKSIKNDRWFTVAELMLQNARVIENPESSRENRLRSWLRGYTGQSMGRGFLGNAATSGDGWRRAAQARDPYVKDGLLHVYAKGLRKHLVYTELEKVALSEIYHMLRVAGFKSTSVNTRVDGQKVSATYWVAPVTFLEAPAVDATDVPSQDGINNTHASDGPKTASPENILDGHAAPTETME